VSPAFAIPSRRLSGVPRIVSAAIVLAAIAFAAIVFASQ
jgi:hypothetical protein